MTIAEMHVMFRQYAQQMGMQNVRAILPEQIDLLLNTAISDTVNQIIAGNVGITSDNVVTDNAKLGSVNSIKGLYQVDVVDIFKKGVTTDNGNNSNQDEQVTEQEPGVGQEPGAGAGGNVFPGVVDRPALGAPDNRSYFKFDASNKNTGKISNSDFSVIFDKSIFIDKFSINYKTSSTGVASGDNIAGVGYDDSDDSLETAWFPVRLIEDRYLADVLNDYILKNRLRSPVVTIYNDKVVDIYIDKFVKNENSNTYYLSNKLLPYQLRVSYIRKPAKVVYSEDINGADVNCDLPEFLHIDIVKHAVDLYRTAISGNLYAQQQADQNQQREAIRNNARPNQQQQQQA